jgi:hypothetical protein
MEMVGQNRKLEHIDPEPASQVPQPLLEPSLAMIEIPARIGVVTAEKAAAYTALNAMKYRNFVGIEDIRPGKSGHGHTSWRYHSFVLGN